MKVFVVIPTYNEAENIERLCRALCALPQVGGVLVVDDASPDGTAAKAQALAGQLPVRVLRRAAKNGRGGAVLDGIAAGLADPSYTHFVEMDADFSHDPAALPGLLAAANRYDVVIGSRYVPGGCISNWPLSRRIFSVFANYFARFMLGVPVRDYTGGYRCYSRRSMEALDRALVQPKGFIALSAILLQLYLKGFTVGEVPIHFVNRVRGESNMTRREVAEAFLTVWQLRRLRKILPGPSKR